MQPALDPLTTDHCPLSTARCRRCQGLGLWIEPSGSVVECPEIAIGNVHTDPNPAAAVIRRSIDRLRFNKIAVNALDFEVAKALIDYTSQKPCPRDVLLGKMFTWTTAPLRQFHYRIEDLRRIWLLPVGSRKDPPAGYWIITELEDFAEWVERSKSAPITQLTTIHRVAKANFPLFAEQLELDFWNNIQVTELPDGSGEAPAVPPVSPE